MIKITPGIVILFLLFLASLIYIISSEINYYSNPIKALSYEANLIEISKSSLEYTCPRPEDDTRFAPNQYIEYAIDVVFLKDKSKELRNISIDTISITMNSVLNTGNMGIIIRNVDTLELDYITTGLYYDKVLKYADDYYDSDNAFIMVVVPEYVVFEEQIDARGRIKPVHGKALSMESNTFFVRDNVAYTQVTTHEFMHCFGIRHIFQEPDYSKDGYSYEEGDYICDTPKSNGLMGVSRTCTPFPKEDSIYTRKELEVLVHNVMSYSPIHCLNSITIDQIRKMRNETTASRSIRRLIYNVNTVDKLSKKSAIKLLYESN